VRPNPRCGLIGCFLANVVRMVLAALERNRYRSTYRRVRSDYLWKRCG
jgi:hypothetical protein